MSVLQYSAPLLEAIVNESLVSDRPFPPFLPVGQPTDTDLTHHHPKMVQFWGDKLASLDEGAAVSYDIEPFDPGLFSHSNIPSAYPPDRSRALFPTNIYYAWTSSAHDANVAAMLRQSTATLRAAAVADGQDVGGAFSYGNYALFGTPVEQLYGANLKRLSAIRSRVDPNGVMALTGGFKF